jgi:hypothetical protein
VKLAYHAGSSMLVVYVNQPPVGGACRVSPPAGLPLTGLTSLLDGITLACSGWTDPEDQGITSYAINSKTYRLTLILTAWEFKKPFFIKMKISPGWLKQNIFF